MKKISLIIMLILLAGCLTNDYYTRPDSKGYYEQVFGALCENCNRVFKVSRHQVIDSLSSNCPYCGRKQDLTMACNRYDYEIALERKRQYTQTMQQNQQYPQQKNDSLSSQNLHPDMEKRTYPSGYPIPVRGGQISYPQPDGSVVVYSPPSGGNVYNQQGQKVGTYKPR